VGKYIITIITTKLADVLDVLNTKRNCIASSTLLPHSSLQELINVGIKQTQCQRCLRG
jgi:hypothetical protein